MFTRGVPTAFLVASAASVALLLQGCGDDKDDTGATAPTPSPPATTTTTQTVTSTSTTTSGTTHTNERLGSFMVIGDWGWDEDVHGEISSRACQQAIADAMGDRARLLGDLKFVINVGDSFYPKGVANKSDPQWDIKWRNVYPEEVRSVPWYSVYGNHDYNGDPCACTDDISQCAQINDDVSNLDYFYMPNTSYFIEHEDLKLEVVALDMNYYTWANHTCVWTSCEESCFDNLQDRMDAAFDLFNERAAESTADNLVVFSHYPTDYFWGFPEFLEELKNNQSHNVHYFGGHRHNVDQRSTTSIAPNNNWLVGGGGGWGCEAYGDEQGFLIGEIGLDGIITTYPVLIDFSICCDHSSD